LPEHRVAELVIAAASHDLAHTGENNEFDYQREIASVNTITPILKKAGLPEVVSERITHMILATDFKVGVVPARKAYLETRCLPPNDEKRLLATQALLLTEADILFSCFSMDYNDLLSRLLCQEWKRSAENLSMKERIGFLSYVQFISKAANEIGLEERRKSLLRNLSQAMDSSQTV